MLEVPLTEVVKEIKRVSCRGLERKHNYSRYDGSYDHGPLDYIEEIAQKVEEAKMGVSISQGQTR